MKLVQRRTFLFSCVALALSTTVMASPALAADPSPSSSVASKESLGGPTSLGGDYLALGDSVPFGYSPLFPPGDPSRYVGYPELAAPLLGLHVTNLSCPGQTSGGFLDLAGSDNGCFPFRAATPTALHTSYAGTQAQAARDFLVAHPRTRLVTIMLGANDVFICQRVTADHCTSPAEFQSVLASYAANLTQALAGIRSVYQGRLLVATYYSTDFSDSALTQAVQALNSTTVAVVGRFSGQVADGYRAFEIYAAHFGGKTCNAGLLIKLPDGSCDVHPSGLGASLLAAAVLVGAHRTSA